MRIGIRNREVSEKYGNEVYKKIAEYGFTCVDYSMIDTESGLYLMSPDEQYKKLIKEKQLAKEAGVEISQVHGPWRAPKDATVDDRAERMEKMKKSIEMTATLGCRNWVIHPIMPFGLNEINTADAEKTWQLNIEFMQELLKTAKEKNIIICLENLPFKHFSLSRPADVLRFVKAIDDENFKICLDTGHVAALGLSAGDAVRELGKEMLTLHVHDSVDNLDLHLMPFYGTNDWEDFATALNEVGFDGGFSFETGPRLALPLPLFDKMGHLLFEIADWLVN